MKSSKRGNPNLGVLGELRRKKGERGLREREDEEKERIEESGEKMRKSAPRNRGSEKDRVTERGNIQRQTERWESVADGDPRARQLEVQALLSFRCAHYGSSHWALAPRAGVVAKPSEGCNRSTGTWGLRGSPALTL